MNRLPQKVLIVEDNEKNLKLFNLIIRSMGYECLNARDGMTGVEMARNNCPDLILMDIQMPKLDGISALQLLGKNQKTRDIPVVAVTSYAMGKDRERLLAAGFSDYLAKPIDIGLFKQVINRIMGAQDDE